MNQVMTLNSDMLGRGETLAIGLGLKQKGLVQDARISIAGPELILIDTDDFTPEYMAYVAMLKYFLESMGIETIEAQLDRI
ncbi:MAG: hypothetical protein ACLQDV_03615 [Candidatus Binataceae bacterium]